MSINPFLKKIGLSETDRAVIIHTDDIGMCHASVELRSIAPDWESRVANYNVFMSDTLKMLLESEDIKLIGYRAIREALRNQGNH